jgi:arylsulfatase B
MKTASKWLTATVLSLATSMVLASDRPNVIVIVADDLGWNDVGFHGGDIDTPSLDRLAAEGMELNRFYTTPICSPTRAALMTGRDPIRLGVAYGVILPWDNNGVHPDEHFMPQSFQAAGYQTAMVGKWHLGHAQMSYHPNNRGFEHFYGHLHTEVGFYPPFTVNGGKDFQRNGEDLNDEGYETFLLADEVSRYIRERDESKPFFVYMPFIAPHTPLDAPQELQDKYKDINTDLEPSRGKATDETRRLSKLMMRPSARPMYAAVVDGMDQAIGQVLDTLEKEGIADNTIVLFFSDNGGAAYSVGGADNVPLRGGKGETFEGGIRVVSVMRWPDNIMPEQKLTDIMTVMDVFPTLADAAGIATQNKRKLDGRSMWPAIAEGVKQPRQDWVYFVSEIPIYGHFNLTVFNDEWKLVQEVEQDQLSTTVTNYLFRIQDDPNEYNNVASKYPEVTQKLSRLIQERRALYPINGTRARLSPPPGWRAPLNWVSYPIPLDELQTETARSPAAEHGESIERMLDWQHGERGRLVYDCMPKWWLAGMCMKND